MNNCFNVVGGGKNGIKARTVASENDLPAVAKDGEIAVVSKTAVRKVYVQNTEPADRETGNLWITYSSRGNNTTTAGNVTIYPAIAYQFADGAWGKIPIYIRAGGEWKTQIVYLLDGGDECVDITGGYDLYGTVNSMAVKLDNGIKVSAANTGYQRSGIQTKSAVDVSEYSRIVFVGNVTKYYSYFGTTVGIQAAKAGAVEDINNDAAYVAISKEGSFSVALDVSNYSGEYYVSITSGLEMIVTQIYME